MKNKLSILALAAIASFAAPAANAAISYTVYSGSPVGLTSDSNNILFSIAQFDGTLGTLTGVTVHVTSSSLDGSFKVTNSGATPLTVGPHTADFRVSGSTPGLGYNQQLIEIDPLVTSPSTSPSTTIPVANFQIYDITTGQGYTVADQNILSGNFATYIGVGNVDFNVRNRLNISATGSIFTVDTSNAVTTTRMAITYTYVPEPSAALLGGLGLLALLRRRR